MHAEAVTKTDNNPKMELKKITFVNTSRFSYGEVNVNGNTLITGTNGAGKTTTILAILFFYGTATRNNMGLLKSEGKEDWFTYSYPEMNSYVIYEYRGIYGRVLLITYNAGTKIGYRFALLDDDFVLDLKSLTLTENNVPKRKEDLFARALSMGLELSSQVTSTAIYRQILYGAIDVRAEKKLSSFSNYALMRTKGNYDLIHEMQSSIFLSSKIESGAIEKAIADNFGDGGEIDISKIRGQLESVISDYEAIKLYDKEKKLLSEIFKKYDSYKTNEIRLKQMISELIAAYNHDVKKLPQLQKDIQEMQTLLKDTQNSNRVKEVEYAKQKDAARSEFEVAKNELKRATNLFEKYKDADMENKALKVDNIAILKLDRDTAKKSYDTLIEEQKDIAKVYDRKLEDETLSYHAKKAEINKRVERVKNNTEKAIDDFEEASERRIESLEKEHSVKLEEINTREAEAEQIRNKANDAFIRVDAVNPFNDELTDLKTEIQQLESNENSSLLKLKNYKDKIASLVEKRELNERQKNDYCDNADEKIELLKKPILKEIDRLKKQLDIDEDTLLYFIREYMSDKESQLTYFLSEKALYNKALEPSLQNDNNSIFGISINQDAIEESAYTREKITEKINECNKKIKEITDGIENELEQKKQEPQKQIESINKEIFFVNKDINETDRERIEIQNRLINLKTDLQDKEISSEERWGELKDRLKKELDESEATYREVRERKNTFTQECSLEINDIKSEIKNFKRSEKEKFNEYAEEENRKLESLAKQFEEIVSIIESDKNEALASGGINPLKLKEAEELQKETEAKYNEANALIESVAVWREDKKSIDLIPQLEKSFNKSKEESEAKAKAYEDVVTSMRAEEDRLSKQVGGLKRSIDSYKKRVEDLKGYIESDFQAYIRKYSLENVKDEVYVDNIYKARIDTQSQERKLSDDSESISRKMNNFISKFGSDKRTLPNYDNSTTDNLLKSVSELKIFIEGGGLDGTKVTIADSIHAIRGNISDNYNSLKKQSEDIHAAVDKISRRLSKAVDNIVVLDDISIKYEESDNKILQKLEEIGKVELPYGEMNSLFSEPDKSKKAGNEILKKFGELLNYLEVEKEEKVTIADTFEIKIKAVENGNSTGWVMARKRIGSEGTSIIVKTLLYVVMLDTVLSMAKKDQDVLVHVLVDEVGKIDQKNLREIINFSNNLSISMFSASPDAKTPDLFNHIYYYRIINGKTNIILGAKKA